MKHIFLILIFITAIFANTISQKDYSEALNSFKQKDYEKSYELFSKLFEQDFSNTLVNFYLGRSAYELQKYEFATSVYDRILINEPNNTRVRLELAQTYLQMKLYTQALKEFELVLEDKMPVQVRKRVEANVAFLKAKEKRHFFDITAVLGIIYDSNVNSASTTFDINEFLGLPEDTLPNNTQKEGATIFQVVAPISYKYKVDENFILNSSLVPLMMKYNNYKDKDLHALSLNISPTFYEKDYKYSFGFLYDLVYLAHEKYQSNYYIKPEITKVFSTNLLYNAYVKLGKVNYSKERLRDANHYEFSNNLKYASENFGVFDFGFSFGKELRAYDTRTDVSNAFYSISLENSYELINKYTINPSISYKRSKYIEEDVNFLSKREDKRYNYSLNLQKSLTKSLAFSLGASFIDVNSNQELYDYDKYLLKANLFYSF